jgi:hypothetical protein
MPRPPSAFAPRGVKLPFYISWFHYDAQPLNSVCRRNFAAYPWHRQYPNVVVGEW